MRVIPMRFFYGSGAQLGEELMFASMTKEALKKHLKGAVSNTVDEGITMALSIYCFWVFAPIFGFHVVPEDELNTKPRVVLQKATCVPGEVPVCKDIGGGVMICDSRTSETELYHILTE